MEIQQETKRNWQRIVWGLVLLAIVLAAVIYTMMQKRVDDNAYFGNLNNYEQVDQQ